MSTVIEKAQWTLSVYEDSKHNPNHDMEARSYLRLLIKLQIETLKELHEINLRNR